MSVQFGRWNIDGRQADQEYLTKAGEMLDPYGPDGGDAYIKDNVGILYRAFHTTKESGEEIQPLVTPSGTVLCWDGRLDNREELIRELPKVGTIDATDLTIVAATYEAWGPTCLAKLIGDWALSVWDPRNRSLLLAKDPIGTRHLYYAFDKEGVTWSTILDPLVLLTGKTFALEEEYIAGWLSFFPATHLTPYVGIHSVPPSASVRISAEKQTVAKHWDFDPGKKIRYRADAEYEEHFRVVFAEAVRRRLRSDRPILAELSGGMDSSSIVCMADTIIADGAAETPRLDTISYYNASEPNWNEQPYFSKVEEKRGRTGCHIEVGKQESFLAQFEDGRFVATPSSGRLNEVVRRKATCMTSQGNRVALSGIGGDEVTGGVPTPTPEFEDLLAGGQFSSLAHQLKIWALQKGKPWFYLFFEAARAFLPLGFFEVPKRKTAAPWLHPLFVKRNRAALRGYEKRVTLFGPLPSFRENIATLEGLQRQLTCDIQPSQPPHEKRYPFLDRNLLEFIYAVPREQLVRPGQRRSLMRRALAAIVPMEILNRKRKGYVVRAPMTAITSEARSLAELCQDMVSGSLQIVDPKILFETLQKVRHGIVVPMAPLVRTLLFESWLRSLRKQRRLEGFQTNGRPEPALPIRAEHRERAHLSEEFS